MLKNKILNDFEDEGFEIDISTRTYPDKSILVDREFFGTTTGKITASGEYRCIITQNKVKTYLARFIMDIPKGDTRKVIHIDTLHCDYRSNNLKVVEAHQVDRRKKNKAVRDYYLEWIRDNYDCDKKSDNFMGRK